MKNTELKGLKQLQRRILEHRQSQDRLRKLYAHERELRQELESELNRKNEFLRRLVHELRTPLTTVIASSEMLVRNLPEGPLLSLARNLDQGAASLDARINELLDLARGEKGMLRLNRSVVVPSQLLQQVCSEMIPVLGRRSQTFILDAPLQLSPVYADAERLRQVLTNLLFNASKFTPSGGSIILKAQEAGHSLTVEVDDSGPGIAVRDRSHLFDPYYRAEQDDQADGGLGLGLALCKLFVELHGGRIWAKDRASGRGSTFGFSLPPASNQDL